MKFKSVVLVTLLVVALISLGGIGYLAFTHKSTSALMSEATSALKEGKVDQAKDLLTKVIRRDSHNEEAFRLLAGIYDGEKDYFSSMYFWSEVAALNPLDKKPLVNTYRAALLSGTGDYAFEKFLINKATADLPDEILYHLGLIALRRNNSEILLDIKDSLSQKKSAYLDLLGANEDYHNRIPNTFNKFVELSTNSPSEGVRDCANVILAADDVARGNLKEAQERLGKVSKNDEYVQIDATLLLAQCYLSSGDVAKAREAFSTVQKMQRANIPLLLNCVELAFSDNDAEAIENLRKNLNISSNAGLALDYYMQSFIASLKGNTEESMKFLNLAGIFRERVAGKILAFKLACDLKDFEVAAQTADVLASPQLPTKLKEIMRQHLLELITEAEKANDHKSAEAFSQSLLVIAPDNPVAIGYSMVAALNSASYRPALQFADNLLKIYPNNAPAFEGKCVSLFALERYKEGLNFTEARLKQEPTNTVAAVFSARFASRIGQNDLAAQRYKETAANVPVEICEEAGNFLVGTGQNTEEFFKTLSASEDPAKQMLAKGLQAQQAVKSQDAEAAQKYLQEAIALYPKAPGVRSALATLVYSLGKKEEARQVLEAGIEANPDSEDLKLRLCALLLESDSPQDKELNVKTLEKLCTPDQTNGFAFALLSASYAALNRSDEAMSAARKGDELNTGGAEAALQLGLRFLERARYVEASEPLKRAYQMSPQDTRISNALTKAYHEAIDTATTAILKRSFAEEALKTFPDDEVAKKAFQEAEEALAAEEKAKAGNEADAQ